MFKRRGFMLVAISLVLGGLSALAANNWVSTRLAATAESRNEQTVVVAALDVPYGTKISSRHLRLTEVPVELVPQGSFKSIEDVEGMVAKVDVVRGETLLESRFAEHETGSTLAALVQKNMRAVTVRVDDVVGVAGFLLPGNHVDVLATKTDRSTKRASTETILKSIRVLAVDQTAATEKNEPIIVRAVTLELTPAQSESLVKAKEEGKIQLTLRNPLDQQVAEVDTEEVKRAPAVMTAPARTAPARATSQVIQVIRGTQVDNKKARI